jgi:hypothetical protein
MYSSSASQTVNMVLAIGVILFAEAQVLDYYPGEPVIHALLVGTIISAAILFSGAIYWGSMADRATKELPGRAELRDDSDLIKGLNEHYKHKVNRVIRLVARASYPLAAISGGIAFVIVSLVSGAFHDLVVASWVIVLCRIGLTVTYFVWGWCKGDYS